MPNMNFWRRPESEKGRQPPSSAGAQAPSMAIPIRDAERRRLARLLLRRSSIEYDLAQAETAFMPRNRWTERIEQLDDAIRQAHEDMERLAPQPGSVPPIHLSATPIEVNVRSVDVPAEIAIQAGGEQFLFREELDWSERGHQMALPTLQQVAGNVQAIAPDTLQPNDRLQFIDHLSNSLSVIANDALKRATNDEGPSSFTLADLTRPCDQCGGWLDPLGRCPACTEVDWQRSQIATALARLVDERNETIADLELARERLPVFRRQLQDVDSDIQELRNKGVEVE